MHCQSIVLATGNPGKLREIAQVLQPLEIDVIGLDAFDQIDEPAETGETFAENARDKAMYYAQATGQYCLADDSGLAVDALGGQPGVRSARYAADQCPASADRKMIDQANNARPLAELDGVEDSKRTARFICHLALARPERVVIETSDSLEGMIGRTPKGDNGFGYDPLFYLPQLGCTAAELPAEKKNQISHRGKAVRKFAHLLQSLLTSEK